MAEQITERPLGVKIVSLFIFISAFLFFLWTLYDIYAFFFGPTESMYGLSPQETKQMLMPSFIRASTQYSLISILTFLLCYGLWKQQNLARISMILLLSILSFFALYNALGSILFANLVAAFASFFLFFMTVIIINYLLKNKDLFK